MSIKGKAYIVGVFEHPTRKATDKIAVPIACRMRQGRARRRRADEGRYRRLFLRRRRHAGARRAVDDRLSRPQAAPLGFDRYRRLVLPVAGRPRGRGDRRRQMQGRADHAGRAAARRGHGDRHRAARAGGADRRRPRSRTPTRRPPPTCTRCARCATCTSTAPPASSSPGSRSRPRTTRNTTRTRCCATWSRSRRWSTRR